MSGVIFGMESEVSSPFLADGFQYALGESTLPGIVICIILLIISSFTWTVMVTKFRTVFKARRASERFLALFRSAKDPLSAYATGVRADEAPLFHVYEAGCKELACQVMGESDLDESFHARVKASGRISPTQMNGVQMAMERAAGESVQKLESSMTLLATAVSGAPFLGLLGTVWGVMDTFVGVAVAEAGAGLAAMAPGVSSALVTTVIALLVAIPAMFGYNFLAHSIKSTVVELDNFSAEFCGMLDRHYVDHGQRQRVVSKRVVTPKERAKRSSEQALMLDRPSSKPRKENARRTAKPSPEPADPRQPSLLDHVGELESTGSKVSRVEKESSGENEVKVPKEKPESPKPSPARERSERPEPTLEIISGPPSGKPTRGSAVDEPVTQQRAHMSVADLIAEEKKKGPGLLLRTLRRAPKRREPSPTEL